MYALVVYTGKDTKLSLNEGKYSLKISDLQKKLNSYLVINIGTMFLLMLIMSQIGNRIWMRSHSSKHYYIFPHKEHPVDTESYTIKALMSYFLLFNSIIPLDLAITYNIIKAWYTVYLIDDWYMVDIERSE